MVVCVAGAMLYIPNFPTRNLRNTYNGSERNNVFLNLLFPIPSPIRDSCLSYNLPRVIRNIGNCLAILISSSCTIIPMEMPDSMLIH